MVVARRGGRRAAAGGCISRPGRRPAERLGECQALAIAYSAFDALAQRLGLDAALESMREIFRAPRDDVRVLFERRPAAALAVAGVDWSWLAAAAAEARQSARGRHAAALARRPPFDAAVDWRSSAGQGIVIETTLSGAPRYAAYYVRCCRRGRRRSATMSRLDVLGASAVLPLSPSRNARVLAVIEVEDEILDCPVRVLAERLQFR